MGVGELEKGKFFQLAYIPVKYGGGASAVIGRNNGHLLLSPPYI